jgi:hypothetical protein
MKRLAHLLIVLILWSGCKSKSDVNSVELINETPRQEVLFKVLSDFTEPNIARNRLKDSVAFLLLPIEAICPSCRKKIIDSIMAHQNNLDSRHYIIISANGGKKTMEAYFRERGHKLPAIKDNLYLDSTNQTFKKELYTDKPIFFYGYNQKILKKVSSVPTTIKEDLHFFFGNKSN